jgi:NADH-quinone oxidoreductase subunit L
MSVWAIPIIPLAGGLATMALRRRPRALLPLTLATLTGALLAAIWAVTAGATGTWSWGPTFELTVTATGFSRVMVVLVPTVALPVLAYAASNEPRGRPRLLALLLAFVGAMQLLVTAADLLTLLIGWELVARSPGR